MVTWQGEKGVTWDGGAIELCGGGDRDDEEEEAEQRLDNVAVRGHGTDTEEQERRGRGARDPPEAAFGVLDGQHGWEDAKVSEGDATRDLEVLCDEWDVERCSRPTRI